MNRDQSAKIGSSSSQVKISDRTMNRGHTCRKHINRVSIVYGGKSRDNQKQSTHLIGVILVMLNLTMFLPACIKPSAVLVPFHLSRMETELLFIIGMNNALLNPWVYTLQSTEFRCAVKDTWFKIYRKVFSTYLTRIALLLCTRWKFPRY